MTHLHTSSVSASTFLFWKLQIVNIYTKTVTVGIPPEFRTSITFNGLTHL